MTLKQRDKWMLPALMLATLPLWFSVIPLAPPSDLQVVVLEGGLTFAVLLSYYFLARLRVPALTFGSALFAYGRWLALLDIFTAPFQVWSRALPIAFQVVALFFVVGGIQGIARVLSDHTRDQASLLRREAILKAVSFAAARFLQAGEWEQNIQDALARLGQAAAVSRVYIFENFLGANGAVLSKQRFEWVAPGITPQIDNPDLQGFDFVASGFGAWIETMRARKPVFGNVREMSAREQTVLAAEQIQSIICVPIFADTAWWGFIGFDECVAERAWSAVEIDALRTAADILGAAITRAQKDKTLRERARHLTLLNEITHAAIGAADLNALLQTLADRMSELHNADAAHITLWDDATQRTIPAAAVGPFRDTFASIAPAPGETTMTASVLRAGHALVAQDAQDTPYVSSRITAQFNARSALGLPLIAGDQKLGAAIILFHQPHAFTVDEIARGEQAAAQVALALAKAQLVAQSQARLARVSALHAIDYAITSTMNLTERLNLLLVHTLAQLRADWASVLLIDPQTNRLKIIAQRGARAPGWRYHLTLNIGEGAAGWIAAHNEPLAIPEVNQDARWVRATSELGETISYLGAPLRVEERVIGVLDVGMGTRREFTAEEVDFLATLASQAAVAIENARLFEQTTRRAERLAALNRVARAVNASLQPDEVLEAIYRETTQVVSADAFFIALYDSEKAELDFRVRVDQGKREPPMRRPLGNTLTAYVISEKKPLRVRDWEKEKDQLPQIAKWGTMQIPASWLGVPIRAGDRILGAISAQSYRPNAYGEEEQLLLMTIADQAGAALENARLFEETQRRALEQSIVSDVLRALNASLDMRHAFPAIVKGVRALCDCNRVSLALLDATNENLAIAALDSPRAELSQGTRLPMSATAAATDILAGRAHLTKDLSAELEFPAERMLHQAGHRSRVNLPLVAGEWVIGSLNLASQRVDAFTPAQLPALLQIANAVAIAIENMRLFEAEQARREELSALYNLSRDLADLNDDEAILNLVTARAVETIRLTFARIAICEADEFVIRAAHPAHLLGCSLRVGQREPIARHPFCASILNTSAAVVLRGDHPDMTDTDRAMLFLGIAKTLCLVPLRVGARTLGILMLGESRDEQREPFSDDKVRLARSIGDQTASALHRAELFDQIESAFLQTVLALAQAMDAKDTYTANHAQRLAEMSVALGREIGLSPRELEDLRYGATLHDVGKIGVPDAILLKPARLNHDEWQTMRRHPVIGEQILTPVPRLVGAARIVRHHHERYDGAGYPDGLAGDAIPLSARILSVVDAYSAIVDKRAYKKERTHKTAIAELKRNTGTQFDPRVVEIFLRLFEDGPEIYRKPR